MKWSILLVATIAAAIGFSVGLMLSPFSQPDEDVKIALWLEVVHRVCTSVGGLGTFVALIFVMRQFRLLRTQSDLVQRNTAVSMDGQLYARLDSFNKFIVEHDKEYDLLMTPYGEVALTDNRSRLHHLCDMGFSFYEEIYKHHAKYDLLDTEDWEEWQQNMAHFFSKPYVRGYWQTVSDRYVKRFQTFADDLLAVMEPQRDGK